MAEERSTDALLAFILGGVAGAVAGILLAPHSGEDTRELLADWLRERRDRTRDYLEDKREVLHHKKEQLGSALDAAKKAYREAEHS